ncbi:hypothetical protein R0J90_17855, partial [Micrococcus sp. SIMBA_144]
VVGAIIWLVLAGYNNNYTEPPQEAVTNTTEENQSELEVEEIEQPDVLSDEFLLLDDQKKKIEKVKESQDVQEGIEPVQLEIPAIDVK